MPTLLAAIPAYVWVAAGITAANALISYTQSRGLDDRLKKLGLSSQGYLDNTQTQDVAVPVLYGRHRIGGNRVYSASSGENNKYLHIVMTLSEGPIEGIETIYLDDKPSTDFGGLVYHEFFNGDGNQGVCETLKAVVPEWDDYTRFTAYLYIRLEFNPDKFTGIPKITAIAKGRKIYDPRSGLTVYSNNPALVWLDWATSRRYGLGMDQSLIDMPSVIDAANWCDTQPNPYTFNGIVLNRKAFLDNERAIRDNFRADVVPGDGTYKLLIRKYDAPVMALTEDEIVADSFRHALPGLADTPNRLQIVYPDAEENWVSRTQTIEDSNAVLQYDLEERDSEIELMGTTNAEQAVLLGTYYLERSRLNDSYSFAAHPKAAACEPGDIITVTHSMPGWTDQPVRIMEINFNPDGTVALTVQEEDEALYDDTLNLSPHTYFTTTLPDPLAVPPEATGVSFTEEEYFNKDVSYTRLKVAFTNPASPFWDYSEVWVNVDGAGYNHYTDAHGSFTIEPVKEGVGYKVKLLSVSIQGVRQGISTATEWSYNVVGTNTLPDDVANFRAIPQSDTVILMWDPVNIVDLQGYEIRRGTSWNGGIFLGFTRAVTFQLNGVAPGTHSYMVKSVDTNGQPSDGYALASATVYGPASYTEKMSELNEYQTPAAWQASTAYSTGNRVSPSTPDGYYYECISAGTSGASEPAWNTGNGATTGDGGVTWKALEAQVFTDMEAYDDPVSGWTLRAVHDSDAFDIPQDLKAGGDGAKLAGWNVLNSASADAIDVGTSNESMLTIDCNAVYSAIGAAFTGPFVYKEITGDFDIVTKIAVSNHDENYEGAFLVARDPDATANEDHIDIGVTFASAAYILANNTENGTNNNSFTLGSPTYLRMTRAGQVFTVYTKTGLLSSWAQRAQYDRSANPFGNTIQVGLAARTGNTLNNYVAQFDYFWVIGGGYSGTYESPVYDRGSVVTRRSWPNYDHFFSGTGSTWADQFDAADLWTDVLQSGDTWLQHFGEYTVGTLRMEIGVSLNGNDWTWHPNFESYVIEQQAKYVKYRVVITDQDAGGYLCVAPVTLKEAYWSA